MTLVLNDFIRFSINLFISKNKRVTKNINYVLHFGEYPFVRTKRIDAAYEYAWVLGIVSSSQRKVMWSYIHKYKSERIRGGLTSRFLLLCGTAVGYDRLLIIITIFVFYGHHKKCCAMELYIVF